MISRYLCFMLGAIFVATFVAAPATAGVVTGDHVFYVKSFETGAAQPKITGTAGICFDPTYVNGDSDYDRILLINRTGTNVNHGLFSVIVSTEAVSDALALATATNEFDNPCDITIDANGDAYVVFDYTSAVWKVTDPTGTAVETKILGSYGGDGDDDPNGIDMMPSGFGLAGYGVGDLLLTDNGKDVNEQEGVFALKADGSSRTELWYENDGVNNTPRCASSEVDGKLYFARDTMETVDVGGTIYPAIHRIDGSGVLETIAIDMPTGETFTLLDNSMAVNPVDGSVWLPRIGDDADSLRSVVRVDVASAADQGGGIYLADATVEIAWDDVGFNIGTSGVCWSPDGKTFVVNNPSGIDSLHIFSVPEPSACLLIGLGLACLTVVYRRQ